jgi:hypothetical protein
VLFVRQSTRQLGDLATFSRDVVVDDDGIGKARPVEVAIDLGRSETSPSQVGHAEDFELYDLTIVK